MGRQDLLSALATMPACVEGAVLRCEQRAGAMQHAAHMTGHSATAAAPTHAQLHLKLFTCPCVN